MVMYESAAYPLALAAWPAVVLPLVDTAIKGFVLLLFTAVGIMTLRRASASLRHLIWVSAMAGLLFLPVLSLVLPRWEVLPVGLDESAVALTKSGPPVESVFPWRTEETFQQAPEEAMHAEPAPISLRRSWSWRSCRGLIRP